MYSNGISRRLIRYLFAERQGFLLRKRYTITDPSGFSSRLSSHEGPKACASGPSLRKDRDSNPGCPQGHNGFRDRPDRPLRHLSRGWGNSVRRTPAPFFRCKITNKFSTDQELRQHYFSKLIQDLN